MTNRFISLVGTWCLVASTGIWAQSSMPAESCGTTQQDGELIKQRLFSNRLHVSPQQIQQFKQQRTVTYIPVTFHLVGTDNPASYPNPEGAAACICALNEDFASQNIQFYINFPLRYMNNTGVYNDGYAWSSMADMGDDCVANTMNIFIGSGTSQPVAGYYSPGRDFIWLKNSYASAFSNTLTHEAGHFYTLAHTFHGWEGISYDDTYGAQPSPVTVGGDPVEYKARIGQPNCNCQTAADGFCDTEADYYSSREACNHNTRVLDPDTVRLTPDNSLYMSYFDDGCMNRFSPEQEDAIAADIIQRGWTSFPVPNMMLVSSDSVEAVSPSVNAILAPTTNTNPNLVFDWNPAPNATAYVLHIDRYFSGVFVSRVYSTVIYGNHSHLVPYSVFPHAGSYRWTVIPFSSYSTCTGAGKSFDFVLANLLGVENTVGNTSKSTIEIMPNPIENETLTLQVFAEDNTYSTIQIYSADGRLCVQSKEYLTTGLNAFTVPVQELASGVYSVSVLTARGVLQKRFVKP